MTFPMRLAPVPLSAPGPSLSWVRLRRGPFLLVLAFVAAVFGAPSGVLEAQAPGVDTPALAAPVPSFPAPPFPSSFLSPEGLVPGTRVQAMGAISLEDAVPVTPRGAFLRSLVVPGWGHLAADSPTRAAFYVAAQGGAGWMLGRSLLRRQNARRFRSAEFDLVREELRAQGVHNPDSLRFQAEADPRVTRWDDLVEIRGDQVEDWVALSIFLAFLGATDALVAAHLADFPEALTFTASPGPRAGSVEMGLRLPWPRRGGTRERD